ncbi:MAG: flagellar hook-basal body complex protein, partial [Limnochordia bacterium]
RQDGLPKGELDGISIDRSGTLIGSYSNGLIKELGRIALARFENPPGLLKVGDTMFAESVNSGDAVIGMANTSGLGAIMSNSLEMSNVDLSNEFTEMIITQRGFQANSRIITSADEMLQELVNLKR